MNSLFFLAQATTDSGPAGFLLGFGVVGLIIALVFGLFWLWMLIDCLQNSRLDSTMKIVWALVVFFLPFIGAVAYFFVGRKGGPV